MLQTIVSLGLPSFILFAGVVDDLRSQKVHNWLILSLFGLSLIVVGITFQLPGLQQGLIGLGMALALCLPLYMSRVLGGGDLKLFMVFGFATDWSTILWVLVYSFIWGALLGGFRAIISGKGLLLLKNTLALLLKNTDKSQLELQKIPYTIALAFGWLTHLTLAWR